MAISVRNSKPFPGLAGARPEDKFPEQEVSWGPWTPASCSSCPGAAAEQVLGLPWPKELSLHNYGEMDACLLPSPPSKRC